jgi:hypothetical protein
MQQHLGSRKHGDTVTQWTCLHAGLSVPLFGSQEVFWVQIYVRGIHCVGRVQGFGVLKQVVHIVTTGFYRVNNTKM